MNTNISNPIMDKISSNSCSVKLLTALIIIVLGGLFSIVVYTSRHDKPLDIKIDKHFKLPVIRLNYAKKDVIPKVYHQFWKSNHIPQKWQSAFQKCQKLNPDYKLILWTDEMIYNFMSKEYSWFYEMFLEYPYHIQRVDVARYFILYHYGGVYLDIDALCKTSFNTILSNMTQDHDILLPMTDIYGVTNSFMVSRPRSSFFKYVIDELPKYVHGPFSLTRHTTVIFSTGPTFMSHCIYTYPSQKQLYLISIRDYDVRYFYHAKGGSWHAIDTEIIDAFHFHYISLAMISAVVILTVFLLKFKRNLITYLTVNVKVTLGLSPQTKDRVVSKI